MTNINSILFSRLMIKKVDSDINNIIDLSVVGSEGQTAKYEN